MPRVHAQGQGGLLDVALDPKFAENRLDLSVVLRAGRGRRGNGGRARRLADDGLENVQVIYRQQPKVAGCGHFGSRIVFRRDGTLFVTQGDRMPTATRRRTSPSGLGKVVRINPDGSIPKDNPFVGTSGARPEIWSYGHRNMQAAALHPETGAALDGRAWRARRRRAESSGGGEELRLAGDHLRQSTTPAPRSARARVESGDGAAGVLLGSGHRAVGHASYTGDAYPGLEGQPLRRFAAARARWCGSTLRTARVTKEERYLGDLGERIRDVQQGPDGLLFLVRTRAMGGCFG